MARPTLTSYRSEKAGDFAHGQGGQGGHGGSTAPSGETRRHASASDGAPPVKAMPAISHRGHHKYPDHPDHADQASELKGLSGQGFLTETAPTLTGPPWPDLDILRRAYGEARGVEAKRAMVAAWAAAAGGLVTGGVLRLPRDLPKGTAATAGFLMIYARCVGLVVGEPLERLCSRSSGSAPGARTRRPVTTRCATTADGWREQGRDRSPPCSRPLHRPDRHCRGRGHAPAHRLRSTTASAAAAVVSAARRAGAADVTRASLGLGSFYGVRTLRAATARDPSSHSGFPRSRTDERR